MTARLRTTFLLLGLVALVAAGIWVWSSSSSEPEGLELDPSKRGASTEVEGEPIEATRPSLDPQSRPAGTNPNGPSAAGVGPGIRAPHGLDLSDPAVRKAYLAKLLQERPIPWSEVAGLLAVMTEPLDPAVRARLLEALRIGDRNGALQALSFAHDPALVPELFAIVDDPAAAPGARRVALQVLGQMPGGERDAVVKDLEARLQGQSPHDSVVLDAIAARGGAEAMRAVSEYVLRSPDASVLAQTLVGKLDVRDPATAAVLAEALGRVTSAGALETLVRLAGQTGADSLAAPLIALDRDDQPALLRQRVWESLAVMGSTPGIEHLLSLSRQPGQFGENATLALAQVSAASPESRQVLLAELDRVNGNPRPELAKSTLLEALGTLRVEVALPQVAASLRDGSERVRNSALRSLGRMGPLARPHVDEIAGLFSNGSEATRIGVAMALAGIGGPEAAKQLDELAKQPNLGPSLVRTLEYARDQARGGAAQASAASNDPEPEPVPQPPAGGTVKSPP